MSDGSKPLRATPAATLEQHITDVNIPKNEAEWWAQRRIEALETQLAEARIEVGRLSLDVAAQEALQDSAYKAGVNAGWNYCFAEDHEGFQAATTGTEHIKELRRIREARAFLNPTPTCRICGHTTDSKIHEWCERKDNV